MIDLVRALVAALLVASGHAQAGLFGPSTYEECVDEATKRPTDAGVKIAMRQCHEKFREPELRRQRRAASDLAARRASGWLPLMKRGGSISEVVRLMGQPDSTTRARCTELNGVPTPATMCRVLSWKDEARSPVECVRADGSMSCYFRLESPIGMDDTVWMYWPESF